MYILKIYSLILVLLFTQILNADDNDNNIDNNHINDALYNKCTRLDKKPIVKALRMIPNSLMTLQFLSTETNSKIKSVSPIYIIAVLELLLHLYLGIDSSSMMLSILTTCFIADIFLSGCLYFTKSLCFETLYLSLSCFPDILLPILLHFAILAMSLHLDIPFLKSLGIPFFPIIISCYFIIKNNSQTRRNTLNNINTYKNKLDYNPKIFILDKILHKQQHAFLYNGVICNEKTDGIAEKFYKWILVHKDDIPLYELNNLTEIQYDNCNEYDRNICNDWKQKANRYLTSKNNKYFIYKESNLKFKLLYKGISLHEISFKKALKNNSTIVLEAIETPSKLDKYQYQYLGIINNHNNYYLFIGIQIPEQQQYNLKQKIISKALDIVLFNNSVSNVTLIVKFNSIDKISNIMIDIIACFGNCKTQASIYNVAFTNPIN